MIDEIRSRIDSLAKPVGSLGQLEAIAFHLCDRQQSLAPRTQPRRLVIFAGDHGVVGSGVSAWLSPVTTAIAGAIRSGVAGSSVLAEITNTQLRLVDVGMTGTGIVRSGSRDLSLEPALTLDEFDRCWQIGVDEADRAKQVGCSVVAAGEIGIGNTTPASCLAMLLAEVPLDRAVGRGAGADDAVLERKKQIVSSAVERARSRPINEAIAAVAGLEIAAVAGFLRRSAELGLVVVLDGFVVGAAALIAERFHPGTARHWLAAHRSAEPGHGDVLAHLGLEPLLDGWNLRLGEGTGALLLMPLLDAAAAMVTRMAALNDLLGNSK